MIERLLAFLFTLFLRFHPITVDDSGNMEPIPEHAEDVAIDYRDPGEDHDVTTGGYDPAKKGEA
jgi:hypothetical protein